MLSKLSYFIFDPCQKPGFLVGVKLVLWEDFKFERETQICFWRYCGNFVIRGENFGLTAHPDAEISAKTLFSIQEPKIDFFKTNGATVPQNEVHVMKIVLEAHLHCF